MMGETFWALILISGILALFSRSIIYGLISLAPNIFPAFIALGLWGLVNGTVGLASSVVFAISMGIVVDDTVHYFKRVFDGPKGKRRKPL